MSDNFLQRIKELETKLDKFNSLLIKSNEKIKGLESENSGQGIQIKDQELKDLRTKLTVYSQERDNLQQELDDKVKELENSNLSNTEKQTQINQILEQDRKELNLLNQNLMSTWTNYNIQRDKMVDYLIKPCSTCAVKRTAIRDLVQVQNYLFGAVFLLLILLLLSFFCGYCSQKKPTKNKKNIST